MDNMDLENLDQKLEALEKELESLPDMAEETTTAESEHFSLELDHFEDKDQEDKLWMARTGLNFDTLCGAVETIVFMSDKPISLMKIKSYIDNDLPLRVLHESISKLQAEYEMGHHGLRLQEVADGYQFRTKAIYSKFVQDIFKVNSIMLTPTALEVLAIIAYKQPVSKTSVEKMRGVDSSHIIRALMDKRLVKTVGRSEEELGHPTLYATTTEFMEVFNLANLSELPGEFELAEMAANNIGAISDIKEIVNGGHKPNFNYDEMNELDELAKSIKAIQSDTEFTKLLGSEDKKRLSGDADIIKSAFDILEEQVDKDVVVRQMRGASLSETLTLGPEARVVDLEKETGLINAPETDSEVELERVSTLSLEASELEEALDDAFARLSFEHELSEQDSEEALEEKKNFLEEDFNFEIDETTMVDQDINEHIINEAKKLDLDLSFLDSDKTDSEK
ncbi:MAG: SMC-Scp complex subunit ScpB [Bacteriovoracaceae bacterium]